MPPKIEIAKLIGGHFGRYTVIGEDAPRGYQRRLICKCECGTVKTVLMSNLKNGTTVSCGCRKKEATRENRIALRKYKDATGKRFGSLRVLEEVYKKSIYARCICDCGEEIILRISSLRRGTTRSCGHLWKKFIIKSGMVSHGWTAIEELREGKYKRKVRCKCKCGEERIVGIKTFLQGIKFCNCYVPKLPKPAKVLKLPKLRYVRNYNRKDEQFKYRKFHVNISRSLRRALSHLGTSKMGRSTFNLLGYGKPHFINHIQKYLDKPCESKLVCSGILITKTAATLDHIIPISSAQSREDVIRLNQLENIRVICFPCNRKKSNLRGVQ